MLMKELINQGYTPQKMKFFKTSDLNGKPHFLCSATKRKKTS